MMMFPQIRCTKSKQPNQPNVFYVLCKGDNAGKPGTEPWVNSFEVVCSNKQYYDFYFWLIYGLFKAGKFKIRLRGSVIPFINVVDVRNCVREVAPAVFPDWEKFQQLVATMDKLEKLKTHLHQQVVMSNRLQTHLINKYFSELK